MIFIVSILSFVGCATTEPYHVDKVYELGYQSNEDSFSNVECATTEPCGVDNKSEQVYQLNEIYECKKSSENPLIGFIEFNDQGQLHSRTQLTKLLGCLKTELEEKNLIIVTFTHGWHHSAEIGDKNLESFKVLLAKLDKKEKKKSVSEKRKPRRIVGVYLGWRGDSISISPLNYVTFWERKKTAETIARRGAVTEVFLELEKIRNTINYKGNNRLITVGHSFGGLITYSALSHIFMERFISTPPNGTIKGFGDLVLLFNPAFEAMQFSHFYTMIKSRTKDNGENKSRRIDNFCQLPVLAIFTSESDLATKYAFPVGRFFSTVFDTHKPETNTTLDEQKADRTAIGHFEQFANYRFESTSQLGEITDDKQDFNDFWFNVSGSDRETEFYFSKTATKLSRLVKGKPPYSNPYLVVQVDKNIIADHNDIWDKDSKMLPFLEALFNVEKNYYCNSNTLENMKRGIDIDGYKQTEKKDKNLAKVFEMDGFDVLINGTKLDVLEKAIQSFQKSYDNWNSYHNVAEILEFLKETKNKRKRDNSCLDNECPVNLCPIYERILTQYHWGMAKEFGEIMCESSCGFKEEDICDRFN